MKVIAVYGSPRMSGNCNTLVKEAVKGARDAGHEVVEYVLNDMFVKGCQGCASCRKSETFCVVNDDLKPYWEQVKEAGGFLTSILSLLFVAPTVGIVEHWGLIQPQLLPIALLIVATTVLTFGISGQIAQSLAKKGDKTND